MTVVIICFVVAVALSLWFGFWVGKRVGRIDTILRVAKGDIQIDVHEVTTKESEEDNDWK